MTAPSSSDQSLATPNDVAIKRVRLISYLQTICIVFLMFASWLSHIAVIVSVVLLALGIAGFIQARRLLREIKAGRMGSTYDQRLFLKIARVLGVLGILVGLLGVLAEVIDLLIILGLDR